MIPVSDKINSSSKQVVLEAVASIEITASLDTLQDMAKLVANPVSSGDKVDFSLTSDSNMLNFSESQSVDYIASSSSRAAPKKAGAASAAVSAPKPVTVAAAEITADLDTMDIAISSASLDLFDLDLLDIDK